MEQRQELSPEMQIFLIASDVEEVKTMVQQLDGTVSEIHIAMVGSKDRPGVFEELRLLSKHKHAEVDELRTEMRVAGGMVIGAVAVIEFVVRLWR